jgi:HK97 family phage portal protein
MNIFKGLFKSRDKPQNVITHSSFGLSFVNTSTGKVVNEKTAMSVITVYACVRVLAEAVAGLPVHVYRYNSDGSKARMHNHPLYRLLHDAPNHEMTSFIWRETLMSHLLIYGNAFSQIVRNGKGEVVALYPLTPDKITVERDKSTNELIYTYRCENGEIKLNRWNILHIPGLGFDGIMGYSPIAIARQTIGMALAVDEYGSSFFANGANPGGVLEFPGPVKDIKRVKESWNAGHQGASNANKIAILEEGAKFSSISISPEQAQFLETRKYSTNEICRLFKVPPHLVGDLERATFSNIEHQSIEFATHSIRPWVARWEQSLQQALVLPSERDSVFVKFNMDGLLRGDYASRMQGYATARQNGWLSANDIRELEDMNRIPTEQGGDEYLVNGNMKPIMSANTEEVISDEQI